MIDCYGWYILFRNGLNLLPPFIFRDFFLAFLNLHNFAGSPETSCQSATTMNLFPTKENNVTPKNLTAMDLLSPQVSYRPSEEIPTLISSK